MPAAHHVLREGGGGLVIAADFALAGRPAAGFAELVAGLSTAHTVWETSPLPGGPEAGAGGRDHVATWVEDVRADGRPVRAVLGFCSGSVYAGAMHREITRFQDPPALVLFDPDRSHRRMVVDYFVELARTRFSSLLTADEVEEAVRAGRAADLDAAGTSELADALGALCSRILPPACRRAGLTGRRSTELAEVLTSYLRWLAAAADFEVRPLWSSATAFNSATDGYGLDAFPAAERPGLVHRVVQCEAPYEDLLRAPDTARLVDELLPR
ncbi:hypothetical protein ACL03H_15530 [Saccharopolyspora sp. MS10]|uniref:hypothetical protein n=1 Tax=Saccharopolyspora sp. MS10 TaxID=3385973 RepID=UPI00399EF1C7